MSNTFAENAVKAAELALIGATRDYLEGIGAQTSRIASGNDPRLGWRVSKKHWLTKNGRLVTVRSEWTDHKDQGHDFIDANGVRHLTMVRTATRAAETTDLDTVTVDQLGEMFVDAVEESIKAGSAVQSSVVPSVAHIADVLALI